MCRVTSEDKHKERKLFTLLLPFATLKESEKVGFCLYGIFSACPIFFADRPTTGKELQGAGKKKRDKKKLNVMTMVLQK